MVNDRGQTTSTILAVASAECRRTAEPSDHQFERYAPLPGRERPLQHGDHSKRTLSWRPFYAAARRSVGRTIRNLNVRFRKYRASGRRCVPICPVRIDRPQFPFACVVLDRRKQCAVVRIQESWFGNPSSARLGAPFGGSPRSSPIHHPSSAPGFRPRVHCRPWRRLVHPSVLSRVLSRFPAVSSPYSLGGPRT